MLLLAYIALYSTVGCYAVASISRAVAGEWKSATTAGLCCVANAVIFLWR